ncbi:hypothetical protein ACFPFV_02145 [Salinicoccus siamensis]|uniref:Thymidylate kinase-like domain-containing protein n=1 Tax=Salinicoccus siamensis TaxID=381830 RepID=A0ABV5Z4G1_9STAP
MGLLNIARNIINNQNICIMGIDGAGKTSTIMAISNILGPTTTVQYMGNKNWETKLGKEMKYFHSKYKIPTVIIKAVEFYYRVLKHYTSANIVIYDRYVWENVLNIESKYSKNIKFNLKKLLYKLIFIKLFPKPKYCFYLTCDLKTSIERKDDIDSKETIKELERLKRINDEGFKNNKHIKIIDTDILSSEETVYYILKNLPEKFLENSVN